jgi:hypothetical protein
MKLNNRSVLFLSVVLLGVTLLPAMVEAAKVRRLASGQWGGEHIQMQVSASSATIEYDCARGTIVGPLKINSRGQFSLVGTYSREHGGPIRRDEQPPEAPAIYSGWTDGRKMTLTVKLKDSGEEVGTFELQRGKPGRVFKCL